MTVKSKKKRHRVPQQTTGHMTPDGPVVYGEPVIESEDSELEQAQARYLEATNGMCAGVGYAMGFDQSETTPKHLRIGVNMAQLRAEALVTLLMAKGVFTELEWVNTLTGLVENDRLRYEELLTERMGQPVKLGQPPQES